MMREAPGVRHDTDNLRPERAVPPPQLLSGTRTLSGRGIDSAPRSWLRRQWPFGLVLSFGAQDDDEQSSSESTCGACRGAGAEGAGGKTMRGGASMTTRAPAARIRGFALLEFPRPDSTMVDHRLRSPPPTQPTPTATTSPSTTPSCEHVETTPEPRNAPPWEPAPSKAGYVAEAMRSY